jgi:hypothetical protein
MQKSEKSQPGEDRKAIEAAFTGHTLAIGFAIRFVHYKLAKFGRVNCTEKSHYEVLL